MATKYIIDANILIQAHRKYYTLDVFVSFWDKIKMLANRSIICSIDKVENEIIPLSDDLSRWCTQELPLNFFLNSGPFLREYGSVIREVSSLGRYTENAIGEFSDVSIADAFLIAFAMGASATNPSDDFVLVTEEVGDPNIRRRVKIPDVCPMFGVRWINTIELFRELDLKV